MGKRKFKKSKANQGPKLVPVKSEDEITSEEEEGSEASDSGSRESSSTTSSDTGTVPAVDASGDADTLGTKGDCNSEDMVRALKAEAQDHYDKYLRAVADLENFKRRAQKERSELLRYAGENLARDLLEVVDNLELALSQNANGSGGDILKGVEMIHKHFINILERHSIQAKNALGQPFDPNIHQAMTTVPSDEHKPGTVMEQFTKTYFLKDKLLRAGQVVVAAAASEEAAKSVASGVEGEHAETNEVES